MGDSKEEVAKQGCCAYLCKCIGCSCADTQAQVKNGVNKKNRSCTDLPWVLVFGCCIAGLISVWGVAGAEGDLDRLLRPIDYLGNVCGKGSMKDKPLGFWPDTETYGFKMCTKACNVTMNNYNPSPGTIVSGVNDMSSDMILPYPTKQFKSYCIPNGTESIAGYSDGTEQARRMVEDLTTAFPVIAGAAGLTLLVGLIYVCLIKMCLSIVVWMATVCTVVASAFAGYSLYFTASEAKDSNTKVMQQVAGALLLAFAGIFLLLMICMRKRIAIAIKVMEVAARSLVDVPQLLTLPVAFQFFEIGIMVVFLYMTALMFSAADVGDKPTPINIQELTPLGGATNSYGLRFADGFKRIDYDSAVSNLFWFHLFMMFWIITFSGYFLYTLMAGVFADWYFTRKDDHGKRIVGDGQEEMSPWPVCASLKRTLVHTGTIAVAAAIIAAIKTLRVWLAYMEKQAGKDNCFAKYFSYCIQCALKCLECCVDAINKRALIMVAIVGEPFCKSATTAFGIIWRNLLRVAVMSAFTWIIILCGKVLVALIPTAAGLVFYQWYFEGEYDGVLAPGIAMLFVNWMVANSFMTVYEVSVDTIFLCFLIDEEANKDSGNMFADPELRKIVDDNAEASEKMAKKRMSQREKAKRTSSKAGGQATNV